MIAVLMGNQDGVQRSDIFADLSKTLLGFPRAQPGIDEDPGPSSRDERRISRAAACQNANLDDKLSPLLPLFYNSSETMPTEMFRQVAPRQKSAVTTYNRNSHESTRLCLD
jgi:hypothetical protein